MLLTVAETRSLLSCPPYWVCALLRYGLFCAHEKPLGSYPEVCSLTWRNAGDATQQKRSPQTEEQYLTSICISEFVERERDCQSDLQVETHSQERASEYATPGRTPTPTRSQPIGNTKLSTY